MDKHSIKRLIHFQLIGRTDIVDLPDFELHEIGAKVDTGAYTNAIHCTNIKVKNVNGKKLLSFYVYGIGHRGNKRKKYYFERFSKKKIRSSNGQSELRYIIKTTIVLFGKKYKSEFFINQPNENEISNPYRP